MREETTMNKDNAVGFGIGLLTGAVIGGVIALLFAPQSGKETRQMIKNKATGMMDAIKGKAAEANEVVDTVKDKTSRAVHELKS
jgi:gas vesicle protein